MLYLVWLQVIFIGLGATVVMDLWAWIQRRFLGIPSLNYALVARWAFYIPKGKFVHKPIMSTQPVMGEKFWGWVLHYATGAVFALFHVLVMGTEWLANPTIVPSLMTGIVTIVFPFFVIQPCLGFGIAATKTPVPWKSRMLSLLAHTSYGIGLFMVSSLMRLIGGN